MDGGKTLGADLSLTLYHTAPPPPRHGFLFPHPGFELVSHSFVAYEAVAVDGEKTLDTFGFFCSIILLLTLLLNYQISKFWNFDKLSIEIGC